MCSRTLRACKSSLCVNHVGRVAPFTSTTSLADTPTTARDGQKRPLDFNDTREAYRSKSHFELLRHYAVFKLFSYQTLVDNNKLVS